MQDDERNIQPVPWYCYQREIARADARDKRIIRALVVIIITVCATIAILLAVMSAQQRLFTAAIQAQNDRWLAFLEQYDIEAYTETYTQDGRGLNLIGDGNEVDYNGPATDEEEGCD
jgi:hypothetical protein